MERGKKSAIGDKPVSKKEQYQKFPQELETSERLPLAREGVETVGDYRLQQATILDLMRADSALGGWNTAEFQ